MPATCAYCREPVDAPAECPTCRTLLHAECVAEVDACPTLGCAGRLPAMKPARPAAAPAAKAGDLDASAARGRRLFLAALLGGGLVAALGWAGLLPRSPLRARPAVPGTLLVMGLEGTDPAVLERIAAGVRREYGCAVEVVADRPTLQPEGAGRPLLAESLIAEGRRRLAGRRVERGPVLGFLVVTGLELTAQGSRFVLGLADGDGAAMSYGRTWDPDRASRTVAQGISSTAWLLGLPRCDRPSCALASFDDMLGSDLRTDELCGACAARAAAWRPR